MNTSKKIRVMAALGTLSGAVWAGTFATFTDSATSVSTFTAGTVDLVAGGDAGDAYAFTALTMTTMKPGDVKYAPLSIANVGSLGFSYTMATSATNLDTKGLADQLTLGITKVATAAACDSAGVGYLAAVTALDIASAEGALSTRAIASRTVAAGASEVLCYKVTLPTASGDSFQAATTTATFTFSATQS